jgi:broad specificity phosphatase PhoE
MRAIVVRHFKTLSNAERRIMGWGDAPPAPDWERDLAYVDRVLLRRDISLDAVYSSGLGRARETARYYAGKRGIDPIQPNQCLNEVNYGCLCDKEKRWVVAHYPQYKKDPDYVYPEGESFRQMQRRSVAALLQIAEHHENQTVLVVSHAGVIRGLVCHFLGLDLGANLKRRISHRYVGDFVIRDSACLHYNELGIRSGFAKDGVVRLPWRPVENGTWEKDPGNPAPPSDCDAAGASPFAPAELEIHAA